MGVLDDERDLGGVRIGQLLVAPDRDEVVAEDRDQGFPAGVVDLGEPLEVACGDARVRREVTQVAGAVGEARVQCHDRVRVVGPDRAQVHGAAVGEHHVGLAVRRIRPADRHPFAGRPFPGRPAVGRPAAGWVAAGWVAAGRPAAGWVVRRGTVPHRLTTATATGGDAVRY